MSTIINAGENLVLERQVSVAQTKTQGGRRLTQKRGPTLYNLEVDVPAQRMNSDKYYAIEEEMITLEYGANDFESANITGKIGGSFTTPRGAWSGTPVIDSPVTSTGISLNSAFPFETNKLEFSTTTAATNFLTSIGVANEGTTPVGFNLRTGSVGGTPQDFGGRVFTRTNNVISISGSIDQVLSSTGNLFWNVLQQGTSVNIKGATDVANWARAFDYVQFTGSTKVYQVAEDATPSGGKVTLKLNSPLVVSPLDGNTVTFGDGVSFNFAMMERPATSYQPGKIVKYGTFKFEEVIRDTTRGE